MLFSFALSSRWPFDSDRKIPEEIMKNIEARYGLDKPLHEQYLVYLSSLLRGDLGVSFRYSGRSVNDLIAESWGVTLAVGTAGLIYALFLGISAGIFAASKPNSWRDYGAMTFSLLGICCRPL